MRGEVNYDVRSSVRTLFFLSDYLRNFPPARLSHAVRVFSATSLICYELVFEVLAEGKARQAFRSHSTLKFLLYVLIRSLINENQLELVKSLFSSSSRN